MSEGAVGTIDIPRQHVLIPSGEVWHSVSRRDRVAMSIFDRHYSRRSNRRGDDNFVGPGEYILLLTPNRDALFLWKYQRFRMDKQAGINCSVFRNEGPTQSSFLILEAEKFAWQKWPGMRLFTFVDSRRIRSSNPGYCFLQAGWRRCGLTQKGLHILEKLPCV